MSRISLNSQQIIHIRNDWFDDSSLTESIARCIAVQREAATSARENFCASLSARHEVSPDALEQILASGTDIHGIASNHSISNVISFNADHIRDSVNNRHVVQLRKDIDELVFSRLRETFDEGSKLSFVCSGHFWYPPGGYMGWHTNSGAPGWRVYLTHTSEPKKSFFRYRDPSDGKIVTSYDASWDVRLFRIQPNVPLWHAVYSETDRFSLGYVIFPRRPLRALAARIKSFLPLG